jgi:hypothetical protein
LQGCCDRDISCPALADEYSQWLPNNFNVNDTLRYVNDNGDEIDFKVNSYVKSEASTVGCHRSGMGCYCYECPVPGSGCTSQSTNTVKKIYTTSGTIAQTFKNLNISISKPDAASDSIVLSYYVFDHTNSFTIGPALKINKTSW